MIPMQQLLNQLRDEREKLPMPIEWDRCYQAIEMVIENTYLPMETLPKQEISDEQIKKGGENAWSDYEYQEGNLYSTTFSDGWKMAIKWYREQLKQKNS